MSDPITIEPKRISFRHSKGKSEEDLIQDDSVNNKEENNVENHGELNKNSDNVVYNETFEEKTCCDYLVNICHCTSWLCSILVSSTVACFENFVEFVQTCQCKREFCCDVCCGPEDSVTDSRSSIKNTRLREISETRERGQELRNISTVKDVPDDKDKEKPVNSSDDEKRLSAEEKSKNISHTD